MIFAFAATDTFAALFTPTSFSAGYVTDNEPDAVVFVSVGHVNVVVVHPLNEGEVYVT